MSWNIRCLKRLIFHILLDLIWNRSCSFDNPQKLLRQNRTDVALANRCFCVKFHQNNVWNWCLYGVMKKSWCMYPPGVVNHCSYDGKHSVISLRQNGGPVSLFVLKKVICLCMVIKVQTSRHVNLWSYNMWIVGLVDISLNVKYKLKCKIYVT